MVTEKAAPFWLFVSGTVPGLVQPSRLEATHRLHYQPVTYFSMGACLLMGKSAVLFPEPVYICSLSTFEPGMVAHTCNPNPGKPEARGSP